MSVQLKPYPEYKDSGLHWLGRIPRHWEEKRAKYFFREVDERSGTGEEELLSISHLTGVTPRSQKNVTMFKPESYVGHKLCQPADLVINTMWAWMAALGVAEQTGIVSPAYGVYRPIDQRVFISEYLDRLLRTQPYQSEYWCRSTGIRSSRLRLYPEEFLKIPIACPPREEQARMLSFLSIKNRTIRHLIRAKQRLMGLLNEQKQAIIHSAVTRGLDPNVHLKPSGVEWLGDIPKHWDEMSLGRCLRRIDQGWSPVADEGETTPDQWVVLTLSSVKQGLFNAAKIKPVPVFARIPDGIEVKDGDLLLTRSNTRELVGDVCIVQGARPKTVICDLIYRLTPEPTLFDRCFLMFQLLSPVGRRQIERDARGSSGTMPKIAQRHIRSWRVVVPPLEEQRGIVEAIEDAAHNVNDALKRAKTEISLLREYRTRLIADVVTGKLDLRHPKLPELEGSVEVDALEGQVEEEFDEDSIPEEALDAVD